MVKERKLPQPPSSKKQLRQRAEAQSAQCVGSRTGRRKPEF